MVDIKIFLSGAMSGLSFQEYTAWRNYIKDSLKYDCEVISPPDMYNFEDDSTYSSEREIMDYDLYQVGQSDLLIVNYDSNPNSIGTACEVMKAHILGIPVIGFVTEEKKDELHSWLIECCNKLFVAESDEPRQFDDLIYYIKAYYLYAGQ